VGANCASGRPFRLKSREARPLFLGGQTPAIPWCAAVLSVPAPGPAMHPARPATSGARRDDDPRRNERLGSMSTVCAAAEIDARPLSRIAQSAAARSSSPEAGSCLFEVEPAEIVDDHRHSVETDRPEHHGVMAAFDFSQFARCSTLDKWPLTSTKVVGGSYRDRYVCLHGIPPKDVTHSMRGGANRAVSPQRGFGLFGGVTIGDVAVWANASSRPWTVDAAARKWMRGVHRSACARRCELSRSPALRTRPVVASAGVGRSTRKFARQ